MFILVSLLRKTRGHDGRHLNVAKGWTYTYLVQSSVIASSEELDSIKQKSAYRYCGKWDLEKECFLWREWKRSRWFLSSRITFHSSQFTAYSIYTARVQNQAWFQLGLVFRSWQSWYERIRQGSNKYGQVNVMDCCSGAGDWSTYVEFDEFDSSDIQMGVAGDDEVRDTTYTRDSRLLATATRLWRNTDRQIVSHISHVRALSTNTHQPYTSRFEILTLEKFWNVICTIFQIQSHERQECAG